MNSTAVAFVILNAGALLLLPRHWAGLPLLVGACYMTLGQGIEIGPFSFTIIRMLVLAGFVRVIVRRERIAGGMQRLDWLMIVWALWALLSSAFHKEPNAALINRLGLVFNTCGIYFLVRVFCQNLEDLLRLLRITAILLLPVAIEMVSEKVTGTNQFAIFGGVSEISAVREGRIRAQGPFAHPILAGTVGAVCLPLMGGLWREHRKSAILGIGACVIMIVASASSGPLLSGMAGIGALFMWHYRHRMRLVRWAAVLGYIALDIVMKAPAYYLIARVDVIGGSTGWHRAALIETAIRHINEWWLAGTDYTRHWMPTGVSWSPDHTDITNHYLTMGVLGGLPLMILFILILAKGFSYVGQSRQWASEKEPSFEFFFWTLGAALFAQAATMISVSYFDQSFLFLYLTLGVIGSTWSGLVQQSVLEADSPGETRLNVRPKAQPVATQ